MKEIKVENKVTGKSEWRWDRHLLRQRIEDKTGVPQTPPIKENCSFWWKTSLHIFHLKLVVSGFLHWEYGLFKEQVCSSMNKYIHTYIHTHMFIYIQIAGTFHHFLFLIYIKLFPSHSMLLLEKPAPATLNEVGDLQRLAKSKKKKKKIQNELLLGALPEGVVVIHLSFLS